MRQIISGIIVVLFFSSCTKEPLQDSYFIIRGYYLPVSGNIPPEKEILIVYAVEPNDFWGSPSSRAIVKGSADETGFFEFICSYYTHKHGVYRLNDELIPHPQKEAVLDLDTLYY